MFRYDIRKCAKKLAEKRAIRQVDAEGMFKDVLDILVECIASHEPHFEGVSFRGYFTIIPYTTPARQVPNPQTEHGDLMTIPARRTVRFRLGKRFKAELNK